MHKSTSVIARRSALLVLALAGVVLWSGCYVMSLNGLFTEESETAFEPALVGAWVQHDKDGDITISFRQSATKKYTIEYGFKSKKGKSDSGSFKYFGRLGSIGDQVFLDVEPPELKESADDAHHLPVHTFWKLTLDKDSLQIDKINDEWLGHYLEKKPELLPATEVKGDLLLTGDTPQIRKMLEQIAGQPRAFESLYKLHRAGK